MADAQNRVRRHRAMRVNPGFSGFTLQIFGHENEVIILDADIKNSGDITVLELLRRPRALFESDAIHFINTGEGNELHRHRPTAVVPDRFIGNDGAVALERARRTIVVQTDRIVFGKHLSPSSRFTAQLLFEQTRHPGRKYSGSGRAESTA